MMGYRTGLFVLALGVLAATAYAAEGDVDYRKATMDAQSAHLKAVALIVQGKASQKADLKFHAEALRELARTTENIFGKDSASGETKAKKDIWDKAAEFEQARMTLVGATAELAAAAEKQDAAAVAQAFPKVADACKGCHSKFRS